MFEAVLAIWIALYVILTIHKKESPYEKYLNNRRHIKRD